jgi:hypothetical protein
LAGFRSLSFLSYSAQIPTNAHDKQPQWVGKF